MKYMLMIYSRQGLLQPETTWNDEHVAYGAELAESGELICCQGLADPLNARVVEHSGAAAVVTHGASVEGVLSGYYLVDCEGLERAVDLAARIPGAHSSIVEVRPVMDVAGLEM